jgi:hypothetical protein
MSQVHGTPVIVTFKAAATLSAYRVVKLSAANTVNLWDTISAFHIGITQQDSQGGTNSSVAVGVGGFLTAQALASITAGDLLVAQTATGLVLTDTTVGFIATSTTLLPFSLGIAMRAADTNSTLEVLWRPSNVRFDF